uniref:Uncharacterized protein n=1 Tax=Opuntia streptacantha TaxID=393608 RepID=A0A7C8ZMT2_OPUST
MFLMSTREPEVTARRLRSAVERQTRAESSREAAIPERILSLSLENRRIPACSSRNGGESSVKRGAFASTPLGDCLWRKELRRALVEASTNGFLLSTMNALRPFLCCR